ncbi:MAG TPA: hypothetical protein DCZ94_16270 [Lentisphaeria bacterium]|nr:MAG: hypothetical protein A2X48_02065 [Lentisphaerae bacterium GWF2_49_21]HBC88505.1 hypothetical protein [Lentisphaeria bacterium]
MKKWFENHIYITEKKLGLEGYRKPIVWFDKMLIILGILSSISGQILCFIWSLKFVLSDFKDTSPIQLLIGGFLMWACGAYFMRTGNRGLIYYHMDFLIEYLEKKLKEKS